MKTLRLFGKNLLFSKCYQLEDFLLKNLSFFFLKSSGLNRLPVDHGKVTMAFYRIAYVVMVFAFLFLGNAGMSSGSVNDRSQSNFEKTNILHRKAAQTSKHFIPTKQDKATSLFANQAFTEKNNFKQNSLGTGCANPVTANAGPALDSICFGQTLPLNGAAGGDLTTVIWTTTGDGNFIPDAFTLHAVYHPGSTDLLNMAFTLTLTANANAPCIPASDEMQVRILDLPVTTTTSNSPACEGSALDLGAGNGDYFFWTGPNGYTGYSMDTTIFPVALNQSGTYYVTVTNASGCSKMDSVVVVVKPAAGSTGNPITACDSATLPWGETVTVTDDYHMIYTAANGCDSIVTIHVTINKKTLGDTTASFCGHFTWYGTDYTTAGEKVHVIEGGNTHGCDSVVTLHLTIPPVDDGFACSVDACNTFTGVVTHDYSGCIATLTVKAFIEGFYRQGRTMTPVLLNQGVAGATEAQVDSVTIELHSTSDFSVILDQYKAVLDTSGHVTGIMNTSSIGSSYYLAFRHRNSVLTCSAKPVFLNVVTSYDFSTHKDSAYGGNLIMDPFGEGMWVIYSGEVSIPVQDEFIGTDDVTLVDNDNIEGLSYFNSDYFMLHKDISGDGYLGTDDVSITNNNNLAGVSSLHP